MTAKPILCAAGSDRIRPTPCPARYGKMGVQFYTRAQTVTSVWHEDDEAKNVAKTSMFVPGMEKKDPTLVAALNKKAV